MTYYGNGQQNEYFEEQSEFKNNYSASLYNARQTLLEEHMVHLDQNPGREDDSTTQNDQLMNRLEDELEAFLQNFVRNGLTIRGQSGYFS